MKPTIFFPVIILIFTLGCQQAPSLPTITATPIPKTLTATPSRMPTKTPTITATPNPYIHFQCPEIVTEIPESLQLEGKIVLEGNPDNWGLFFFEPTSNALTKASKYNVSYYSAVSPNGEFIAYQLHEDNNQRYLAITDAENNILKTMPWQESWYEVVRWINDEQLTIANSDEKSPHGQKKRMVLVTPFKDKLEYINLDELGYPDYNSDLLHEPWVEYDPTRERAVYLSWDQHILLNTQTKEILAVLPGSGLGNLDIDWSRDGSFVTIIAPAPTSMLYAGSPDELYIISRNGEVYPSKLTDFLGENKVDFSTSRLLVEKPSWSPNGRFIAFWEMDNLSKNGDWGSDWRLAIFDVKTRDITSYCSRSNVLGVPSSLIWSPNSQQIVITGHNYTIFKNDPVYMIDIPNNVAIEIAQNAIPIGWMVSTP